MTVLNAMDRRALPQAPAEDPTLAFQRALAALEAEAAATENKGLSRAT